MTVDQNPTRIARGRLRITGPTLQERIHLDDTDISAAVRAVTLNSRAGHLTTATVDLVVVDLTDIDVDADIYMPAATRDLLVRYGWTPPDEVGP